MTIPAGLDRLSQIAVVTYNLSLSTTNRDSEKGSIVVQSKDGETLSIPYYAELLHGYVCTLSPEGFVTSRSVGLVGGEM